MRLPLISRYCLVYLAALTLTYACASGPSSRLQTKAAKPWSVADYLMGVGAPEDLLEAVERGVDLFDCVLPTRLARNAALLTREGRLNMRNAAWRSDPSPVEPGCQCYTCRTFSRSYLRHLFTASELLAYRLATIHNLHFLLELMRDIRATLQTGQFPQFKKDFLAVYSSPLGQRVD